MDAEQEPGGNGVGGGVLIRAGNQGEIQISEPGSHLIYRRRDPDSERPTFLGTILSDEQVQDT